MKIEIQITPHHIEPTHGFASEFTGVAGAVADFSGVVRGEENGEAIAALEYEAFSPMAENEMSRILESLAETYPCLAARVIHRVGIIPAGEIAIQVVILARHREAAFATLSEFMNRLKQDVPIWKRRALPLLPPATQPAGAAAAAVSSHTRIPSVDEALEAIRSHVNPLDAVATPLELAAGRILRETVRAHEDLPTKDRSTRDGFAILQDDSSTIFRVVDTLYAADWKPRELKNGEAVRVATGTAMPCENLRVVMQEDVERENDTIIVRAHDDSSNVRRRGEEMSAGQPILPAGTRLNAGALALLATIGCARPKVSPRLKVLHFLTGDELVPPDQKPLPGQIRDSNSSFIRGCLQPFPAELRQQRLPEDFARAEAVVIDQRPGIEAADLLLISGGASVGDKDYTRKLMEFLGFQTIFRRVDVRPGAPLIFGVAGRRIAFGLPGNPLSHFVAWHVFVTLALARLTGGTPPVFSRGTLSGDLLDAGCPRETLWPARCQMVEGRLELTPLRWNSAGDVTCLAQANALIRVPADTEKLKAGAPVEFLSTSI